MLSRTTRSELLAVADAGALVVLADRCLVSGPGPVLTLAPRLGTVPFCVREPVVGERFLLADVLATEAEVEHRGARGWAMRLGDDPAATLAAAICDAEAQSGEGLAPAVESLCLATRQRLDQEEAREWQELEATVVRFEELA